MVASLPERIDIIGRMPATSKVRKEFLRVMVKLGLAQPYQPEFFAGFLADSRRSAEVVAPMLLDLLAPTGLPATAGSHGPASPASAQPRSVIDVGCGTGTWLAAFAAAGITDYLGLDGDYVRRDQLQIPADRFKPVQLTEPFTLDRTFDLAISLEVAEHLPPSSAESFVASITRLAPAVYFGAAVPGQGGTGHVNEQWPSWWAALFAKHGYLPIDAIRPRVWTNPHVSWWYSQNALLYVRQDVLRTSPTLANLHHAQMAHPPIWDIAHPTSFARTAKRAGR
ncbi:MAG: class I SAM-dependent methyltransferase [Phycisphaerales bacterium]|nr:class I SAM-dependent methyltransferase [Phycisphaerales bacterium]